MPWGRVIMPCGGRGDDAVLGGEGDDAVLGGEGDDAVRGEGNDAVGEGDYAVLGDVVMMPCWGTW